MEDNEAKLEDLKRRVAEVLKRERERRERTMHPPDPPPRYDEAYFDFVGWLDSQ